MKRTSLLGLLLTTAIAAGCTVTPYSSAPTSGSTHSATVATVTSSDVPAISAGSATAATVSHSITASIPPETVRTGLRGVHWVLTSIQRGTTVTDVSAFTPVFLELTASHFTVDTGIRVFMFHYTEGQRLLMLGSPPPYVIAHGGYTRQLGPAPLLLNDILRNTKSLRYVVSRNSLRLTAGGLILSFRRDGPATMHYWSEPDN